MKKGKGGKADRGVLVRAAAATYCMCFLFYFVLTTLLLSSYTNSGSAVGQVWLRARSIEDGDVGCGHERDLEWSRSRTSTMTRMTGSLGRSVR